MAETIKERVADGGQKVADTAKTVGHKVAEGAEKATGYVREKTGLGGPVEGTNAGVAGIKERMDVIASCGKKTCVVDHVEGGAIKLTKNDSPDGHHHFIPKEWVQRVDSHVDLSMNSMEAERDWNSDAAACGCS
jgi:hypothetical protein